MKEVIEGSPSNKATAAEIPIQTLKESGFTFEYLNSCLNEAILSCKFPDSPKLPNIVPVHKKKDLTDKCNYRPVSILPLLSQVFEKTIRISFIFIYFFEQATLGDFAKAIQQNMLFLN